MAQVGDDPKPRRSDRADRPLDMGAVIEETVSAENAWVAPLLVTIDLHRLNRYLLRRELRRLVEPE